MVLDCGATKTFASVTALEDCLEAQREAGLLGAVEVDTTNRPRFGFANGDSERTASRSTIPMHAGGKKGSLAVFALNTKADRYVPILGAMEFLQKSQATINFGNGWAQFKAISPQWIQLERISSGHLVVDLTKDMYLDIAKSEAARRLLKSTVPPPAAE